MCCPISLEISSMSGNKYMCKMDKYGTRDMRYTAYRIRGKMRERYKMIKKTVLPKPIVCWPFMILCIAHYHTLVQHISSLLWYEKGIFSISG